MRDSLRSSHGHQFARVTVIGVSISDDLRAGVRYLEDLGANGWAFDQISVGGSWMNELMIPLIWRQTVAKVAVPQVLLVERHIDATGFPDAIAVERDTVLLDVVGRDKLIAWVDAGTPLGLRK